MLVGQTLASNSTGEELLVVVKPQYQALINTNKYFIYRRNPYISNIFPLSHLLRCVHNQHIHVITFYDFSQVIVTQSN